MIVRVLLTLPIPTLLLVLVAASFACGFGSEPTQEIDPEILLRESSCDWMNDLSNPERERSRGPREFYDWTDSNDLHGTLDFDNDDWRAHLSFDDPPEDDWRKSVLILSYAIYRTSIEPGEYFEGWLAVRDVILPFSTIQCGVDYEPQPHQDGCLLWLGYSVDPHDRRDAFFDFLTDESIQKDFSADLDLILKTYVALDFIIWLAESVDFTHEEGLFARYAGVLAGDMATNLCDSRSSPPTSRTFRTTPATSPTQV